MEEDLISTGICYLTSTDKYIGHLREYIVALKEANNGGKPAYLGLENIVSLSSEFL